MPRHRERKTSRVADGDTIRQAVAAVSEGASIRSTAKKYNLDHATLSRYVKKRQAGDESVGYRSASQVFSENDEKTLVQYLLKTAECFFGLTPLEVRALAYQYATANDINVPQSWRENRQAGKDWFTSFMKRNSQLSIRTPQATSLSRATSFNRENVGKFFQLLQDVLEKHDLDHSKVWNLDETGCTTVQKPCGVVAGKGLKQVGGITSGERGQLVTMCAAVNGSGNTVPPMFIFPRMRYHDWYVRGGPLGCIGAANKSGWMTADEFVQFMKHFIKHVRPTRESPVLLLLDNHSSHLNVEAIDLARDNGIVMLSFPPHCSHRLQPLDRSVFGPFKRSFSLHMDSWMRSHPGQTVSIYNVPEIAAEAWLTAATPKNIQGGFRAAGVMPFNPEIFSEEDFAPSHVTDRDLPSSAASRSASANPGGSRTDPRSVTDRSDGGSGHGDETGRQEDADDGGDVGRQEDADDGGDVRRQEDDVGRQEDDVGRQEDADDGGDVGGQEDADIVGVSRDGMKSPVRDDQKAGPSNPSGSKSGAGSVSPYMIRPIPKAGPRKATSSGRRKRKAALLTNSPVKKMLETERQQAQAKKQTTKGQKKKKPTNAPTKSKRPRKGNAPKPRLESSSSSDDDDTFCLVCVDSYKNSKAGERWIQCQDCSMWAHEECSGVEKRQAYICDNCTSE